MTATDRQQLYREEWDELQSFVATLSVDERQQATGCGDWSVGDVVHHVEAWDRLIGFDHVHQYPVRLAAYGLAFARARGSTDRLNERLQRSAVKPSPAPRRRHLFDRLAPGSQLAELVVHHQDIRRALDRPRTIPAPRLRAALDGVHRIPGLDTERRLQTATWRATDVDWSGGHGPVTITGPGEAILLTLAGRATELSPGGS